MTEPPLPAIGPHPPGRSQRTGDRRRYEILGELGRGGMASSTGAAGEFAAARRAKLIRDGAWLAAGARRFRIEAEAAAACGTRTSSHLRRRRGPGTAHFAWNSSRAAV